MKAYILLCLCIACFMPPLWSQELYRPKKTIQIPIIDGTLQEAEWNAALVISDFLQRVPREGQRPSQPTEFLLLYSDTAIYIGVRAFDSNPEKIVADVMRRDDFDITQNDQIAIAIDSYNDGRNGYWFSTNPLGVRVDAQFSNEGDIFETNWDGSWQCSARKDAQGWTAEFEIPFSTLRFHDQESHIMGINLYRRIIHTNEGLFAPLIPLRLQNGTPNVSVARKYYFEGISTGKKLLLKPYVLGGLQSPNATEKDAGLDFRYNLTNNLVANVSIHTDFAETEVDDQQINLTRFSLFFPEKRDFFLENAANFLFGVAEEADLFFSRTIGLVENETGDFVPVPITVGAKVTGKLAGADVGLLHVRTKDQANSSVMRIKAGVTKRSYIGAILTSNELDGNYDFATGADWNLYFFRDIAFNGFVATNKNAGDSLSSDSSAFYGAAVKSGDLTSFSLGVLKIGSQFQPDLGFIRRPGTIRYDASLKVPFYIQTKHVRRFAPGYSSLFYTNDGGELENSFQELFLNVEMQSSDFISMFVNRTSEKLVEPFLIFDPVTIQPGEYSWYEIGAQLMTKTGRKVFGSITVKGGGFYDGSHYELGFDTGWKMNKHFTFSGAYYTDSANLSDGHFRTHLVRSKINYALNTSFSVDVVNQFDNFSKQLGANLRVNYIVREGTELIFVFNELTNSDRYDHQRSALLKFTYLWQF